MPVKVWMSSEYPLSNMSIYVLFFQFCVLWLQLFFVVWKFRHFLKSQVTWSFCPSRIGFPMFFQTLDTEHWTPVWQVLLQILAHVNCTPDAPSGERDPGFTQLRRTHEILPWFVYIYIYMYKCLNHGGSSRSQVNARVFTINSISLGCKWPPGVGGSSNSGKWRFIRNPAPKMHQILVVTGILGGG